VLHEFGMQLLVNVPVLTCMLGIEFHELYPRAAG
jgi:hypothetical protein